MTKFGFIIDERKNVKEEISRVIDNTRAASIALARESWGLEYGGLYPESKEFGETTIRSRFFKRGTTTGVPEKFEFNLATTGWQTVYDDNVMKSVYIGIVGFAFPNTVQKINLFQISKAGNTILPVMAVDEMHAYEEPVIVFKKGLVIPEESPFKLEVSTDSKGRQFIVPIGFAHVKKEKLTSQTPSTT